MSAAARMRPQRLEDLLLRAALDPDPAAAERAAAAWAAEVDIDKLDFGSLLLLPLINERPERVLADERIAEQVRKVARMSWLRTETLSRQCEPAIAALAGGGFHPILIKGAALVYAYGVPARQRPMFDIDVLVAPADVAGAAAALLAAGYSARDAPALIARDPRILTLKHGAEFTRDDGASVDLHWSPVAHIHRPELAASLMENAVPAKFLSVETRAPGAEDLLMVTIAHAADSWRMARDRWVGDCAQLLRGHAGVLDWDRVVSRARDWRLARQTLDALDYLRDVAGLDPPSASRRELERARVPLAVRLRRSRGSAAAGPRPSGRVARVLEDYESDIADHVALGAATGPADAARYLARRWGLDRTRDVPGEAMFVALGRPWRTRRTLRRLLRRSRTVPSGWARYEPGAWARFDGGSADERFLGAGWWFPEDFGTWSRGRCSRVRLAPGEAIAGDAELRFGIRGLLSDRRPEVSVDVVVNDHRLARVGLTLERPADSHLIRVPAAVLAGRAATEIVFVADASAIPVELGLAPDGREIGIGLDSVRLTPV